MFNSQQILYKLHISGTDKERGINRKHDVSDNVTEEEMLKVYDLPFTKYFADRLPFLRYIPCCSCYKGISCTCCDRNITKTNTEMDNNVHFVELVNTSTMTNEEVMDRQVDNGCMNVSGNINEGFGNDGSLNQASTKL